MSRVRVSRITMFIVTAALAGLIIAGCAKKPMWGDPDTGLILRYRAQKAQPLTYRYTNDFTQNMDIMGQSITITADEMHLFTMTSTGMKPGNLMLAVAMDSMSMNLSSPQGDMAPDLSTIPGKSFEMVVSPLGRELEIIGADAIEYEVPGQGKRSIESTFSALFPDLPAGPVTVGGSWTTIDSIPDKSESGEMLLVFNNTHTLSGYETMHGMECAVITTTVAGTLYGTGSQGGMELISEADIKGTDTWYFAYEKGIFVGSISNGTAEGTIKDAGGQGLNIPMTREYKMALTLVKKQ